MLQGERVRIFIRYCAVNKVLMKLQRNNNAGYAQVSTSSSILYTYELRPRYDNRKAPTVSVSELKRGLGKDDPRSGESSITRGGVRIRRTGNLAEARNPSTQRAFTLATMVMMVSERQ